MAIVRVLKQLSSLLAALVAVALMLGFLAPLLPVADSFAHFRFHLTIALALAAVILLVMRDLRGGAVACAVSRVPPVRPAAASAAEPYSGLPKSTNPAQK